MVKRRVTIGLAMATAAVSLGVCVDSALQSTPSAGHRTVIVGKNFRWAEVDAATGQTIRSGNMSNLPPGSTVLIDPRTGEVENLTLPR